MLSATIILQVFELKFSGTFIEVPESKFEIFAKTFEKLDLVILDELEYISFDLYGAELLFQYIALRYEIRSTIIASNLVF